MNRNENKTDVIQIILTAMFVIVVMVATLAVSEDENPFPTSKPPPTGAMVPAKGARAKGARNAHGTGSISAPSK